MNPLIPSALDVTFAAAMALAFVLTVIAFVSLMRSKGLSSSSLIVWLFAILLLPFAGSAGWFLFGKPSAATHGTASR